MAEGYLLLFAELPSLDGGLRVRARHFRHFRQSEQIELPSSRLLSDCTELH